MVKPGIYELLVLVLPVLVSWLVLAVLVGVLASRKGRSFVGWMLLAILVSPLIAGIVLLVTGYSRRCPLCGGGIPEGVTVCQHCGRDLPTDEP